MTAMRRELYGDICFENEWSIRVYETLEDIDYIASAIIRLGFESRGIIGVINGKGFYKATDKIIDLCKTKGLKTLEGYVSDAHARLLKRMFKDRVTIKHYGIMADTEMPWVIVTL